MSVVFALVLFGCADDGTSCQRLDAQVERYATKALCQAQQETALDGEVARRSDFPTVISRCLRATPAQASRAATRRISWQR